MQQERPILGQQASQQAASVIVLTRDTVLMVQRGRPPFEGRWSFPGGRSEPGEAPEVTARRELLEETGLTVSRLIPLGSFHPAPDKSPMRLSVFAARAGPGEPRAGDDAIRAEFVPFEKVLLLKRTAGAAAWIARALLATADPGFAEMRLGVALRL